MTLALLLSWEQSLKGKEVVACHSLMWWGREHNIPANLGFYTRRCYRIHIFLAFASLAANHTDPSSDIILGVVSYGPDTCMPGSWTVFSDVNSFNTQVNSSCSEDYSSYNPGEMADGFLPFTISLFGLTLTISLFGLNPGYDLAAANINSNQSGSGPLRSKV
jgi:hypothetical protein